MGCVVDPVQGTEVLGRAVKGKEPMGPLIMGMGRLGAVGLWARLRLT